MKPETKQKFKKIAKICTGVAVGALALLGVISLGGMVKSCSQGEITPVVTTPVVTSVTSVSKIANPKKASSLNGNIQPASPFAGANKWAELQLSKDAGSRPSGLQAVLNVNAFVFGIGGKYWELSSVNINNEGIDNETEMWYYTTDFGDIADFKVDLTEDRVVEIHTYGTLWTLPEYSTGNFIGDNLRLVNDMLENGVLASKVAIGEIENPVFEPHKTWTVNYSNTGGYWVDNVTGGVVTQMTNGQTYDLVWVSVQGYLYPSDVQVEEHTSSDGGTGIFSTKDGRVHMEFMAADPALLDRITIATNLSSLAIPNSTTPGDDQVNTAEGMGNSFALLGSAFSSMAGLLSMQVFPGLSLSALLFVPVVVAVILFILKAIGK